jgi:hypothetical protein
MEPNVHFCVHKSLQLISVLGQINPVHVLPTDLIKTHFNIILPSSGLLHHVGWGSVVGIATRYGLDGPGIESWW